MSNLRKQNCIFISQQIFPRLPCKKYIKLQMYLPKRIITVHIAKTKIITEYIRKNLPTFNCDTNDIKNEHTMWISCVHCRYHLDEDEAEVTATCTGSTEAIGV